MKHIGVDIGGTFTDLVLWDDDDDPDFPNGARADHVELEMDGGAVLVSDEVTRHRGHGQNPMTVVRKAG